MKEFKDCVNVNSPEFKALAAKVGETEAELLTRLNNMEIPSVSKALDMQKKHRTEDYKDLLDYLENAPSIDEIGIRKRLVNVVSLHNGINYVVSSRDEVVTNVFSGPNQVKQKQSKFNKDVFNSNVKTLQEWNKNLKEKGYPELFTINPRSNGNGAFVALNKEAIKHFNVEKARYIDDQIEFYKELNASKETEKVKSFPNKLERTEDQPIKIQEKYLTDLASWLFSPKIDHQDQLNTINTLSGKV